MPRRRIKVRVTVLELSVVVMLWCSRGGVVVCGDRGGVVVCGDKGE